MAPETITNQYPASHAALRADRNRFVAWSFCWGELLFELRRDYSIVRAAGPTATLLGRESADLSGSYLLDLVPATDRAFAKRLMDLSLRLKRIHAVPMAFTSASGGPVPFIISGYQLDDLQGHIFLALRRGGAQAAESKSPPRRATDSGLLDGDTLASAVSRRGDDGRLEPGQQMTVLQAGDYGDLQSRLDNEAEHALQRRIGALLRASSVDGELAARLTPDRYGVIHDATVDMSELRDALSDVCRNADPLGQGVNIASHSVEIPHDGTQSADIAKGLVYAINRFRTSSGNDFCLQGLTSNLSSLAGEAMSAVSTFRQWLVNEEFSVVFHPIVSVRTGAIHHYEALARFPAGGDKSPFDTILFAEETGLIVDFDLAMARRVIAWLNGFPRNGSISVAVNVSGASVGVPAYVQQLTTLLNQNTWSRGRLLFEITESARVSQVTDAVKTIQALRALGHPVCLDDFGAGSASFQYLSQLEVDIVKFDGTALRNARSSPKGRAFLKALVGLCHEIGVETVAEVIETNADLQFVRDCGVDFGQGYLFGEPACDIETFRTTIPRHVFAAA